MPERTLALGRIFLSESGRGGRRDGKAYEAVVPIAKDRLDTSLGFRVRISGRIARTADVGPVVCRRPGGAEQRPICLVSVVIDEIAVENAADGSSLAIWNPGAGDAPEG